MIEQVREAVNALRMLEDCKKNHTACNDCPQYYFGGKIACHPIEYVYGRLADLIESLVAELDRVKCERDAAVEDLRKVCQATGVCFCCKSRNTGYAEYVSNDCTDCIKHCNWQWRGVKEKNNG